MRILVLGSAAGGGFPQWNCNCVQCQGARNGSIPTKHRTQSSIAVTVDDSAWLLINASPDIRQQLTANAALWPQNGTRHSPIASVLVTDAQIDHVTGLLMLREGCSLDLYCTDAVHEELSENFPLLRVLSHWNGGFRHRSIPEASGQHFEVACLPGARIEAVPLVSNAPPYSPRRNAPRPGDNVGLWFEWGEPKRSFFYAPGLGEINSLVRGYLERANLVMVDGTFWKNDEMAVVGLGAKQARDMGHLPLSGSGGMLEVLDSLGAERKILVHINNTNPILHEDSNERRLLAEKGVEVGFDGMEIRL